MDSRTVCGYDPVRVNERVRDIIDDAYRSGFRAYTHESWLSNGGYEVTITFSKDQK